MARAIKEEDVCVYLPLKRDMPVQGQYLEVGAFDAQFILKLVAESNRLGLQGKRITKMDLERSRVESGHVKFTLRTD